MREPIVVSLFLLFVLLNVSVTQIVLQQQTKTSTSNSSQITSRGQDGYSYILVFLMGFMCAIINTQVFFLLPYLNIQIQKVPIVLIFLIIAKDLILLMYFKQAETLMKVLFYFMGLIVEIYSLIYCLRQIQIIAIKKQNSWNIQPIIQTLLVFYILSYVFRDAFATKILSLESVHIVVAEATLLLILLFLALCIYKQHIFKEQIQTIQNQQEEKQCKLLKPNNSLLSIHILAKINSVSYAYLLVILLFSGATQFIHNDRLTSLQNLINQTQLNLKTIYGFGCLLSLALFNIFLKRNIELSAKIFLIANFLATLLLQYSSDNSTFTIITVVLAGVFQNLLIVWVLNVILLVLQVKFQEIALLLTWKFIGSTIVYFSNSIFQSLENTFFSIIINSALIFILGMQSIRFLNKFYQGQKTFYRYMKGQQEGVSNLGVKNDNMEVQIKNQFMPSSNIKLDNNLKYAHLEQQKN